MLPLVRGCNPLFTKFIELCSWRAMYSPGNDFSFVGHRTSLKRQLKLHVRFAGAHQTAILRAEISFHPWKHASLVAHTITKKKISRREREGGGGAEEEKKLFLAKVEWSTSGESLHTKIPTSLNHMNWIYTSTWRKIVSIATLYLRGRNDLLVLWFTVK